MIPALAETTGSTPLHPDDQLDRLAHYFLESDLMFFGVSFIEFARTPATHGFFADLQPFRLLFPGGAVAVCAICRGDG